MKTSEFVKRMEDIDLSVEVRVTYIEVYYKMHKIMVVQRRELWGIDTRYYGFLYTTPENIRKVAISEAIEYINTPLEEREEPKKYYLRLPDVYTQNLFQKNNYLNYVISDNRYIFDGKEEKGQYKTKFTQEEIEDLPEQNFVKELIKEEVKC